MSKKVDKPAEGQVAPENLPPEERETSSSGGKKQNFDPTAEGQIDPENMREEDSGPIVIGKYMFPSIKLEGNSKEREKQREAYKKQCQKKVSSSGWIMPTAMEGDLLAGYFDGLNNEDEFQKRALEYIKKYAVYYVVVKDSDNQIVVRSSVLSCSNSDRLTHLDIFKDHGVQNQAGMSVMTSSDSKVGENLFSFGICKSNMANVQNSPLITLKNEKNVVKGHMCMLQVPKEWMTNQDIYAEIWNEDTKKYDKHLLDSSILTCTYGAGIIRIVGVPLVMEYAVSFISDYTDKVFNTQNVEEGKNAVVSQKDVPAVSGFKFYKWDSRKYRNVQKTEDIRAIYNPEDYADTNGILSDELLEQSMSLLPSDLNATRRAVIQYALESVGTIPYYFGGKSVTPGYTQSYKGDKPANDFDKPNMAKDHAGRTYRGLDCSGWIFWVRWSVTGDGAHHDAGTWQLSQEGEATDIDHLKAGDILVRTAKEDSHIIMFLAYVENNIVFIQESGGDISNVNIKIQSKSSLNSLYNYKRNLDGWYGDGK